MYNVHEFAYLPRDDHSKSRYRNGLYRLLHRLKLIEIKKFDLYEGALLSHDDITKNVKNWCQSVFVEWHFQLCLIIWDQNRTTAGIWMISEESFKPFGLI